MWHSLLFCLQKLVLRSSSRRRMCLKQYPTSFTQPSLENICVAGYIAYSYLATRYLYFLYSLRSAVILLICVYTLVCILFCFFVVYLEKVLFTKLTLAYSTVILSFWYTFPPICTFTTETTKYGLYSIIYMNYVN